MKRLFITGVMLIAGIFILSANASQVDGRWTTIVPTPDGGEMELFYVFKVDGEKLTGMVSSPMGETMINNGRVGENEYSFDIDAGMGYPLVHKFRLAGEIIRITVTIDGYPYEFVLTKVKE